MTQLVSLILIRWIVIYPMDSAIQRLNNRCQILKSIFKHCFYLLYQAIFPSCCLSFVQPQSTDLVCSFIHRQMLSLILKHIGGLQSFLMNLQLRYGKWLRSLFSSIQFMDMRVNFSLALKTSAFLFRFSIWSHIAPWVAVNTAYNGWQLTFRRQNRDFYQQIDRRRPIEGDRIEGDTSNYFIKILLDVFCPLKFKNMF